MNEKLTVQERLKDLRKNERNLTLEQLAEATGLSRSTLGNYETNDFKDISPFSIVKLAQFYGVSTDYLMGLTEQKNHSDTALDELHLSDEMIELLKSGKINNRLLCELAGHEGFRRLMVDLEIYVDRIANMRIHDLNSLLKAERKTIMENQGLDDNNLQVRMLELAQVDEDDYFAYTIFEDLRPIIHDIREAHRDDITTADTKSPAEDALHLLESALSYEGSPEEKVARIFLSQLDIDYDAITKDEFVTLIGILNKSGHVERYISRRGKAHPSQRRKKRK